MEFNTESYIDEEGTTEIPSYIKEKLHLDKDYIVEWAQMGEDEYKVTFRKKYSVFDLIGHSI